MAENTGISWTDCTFNIAWGCTKVSPGCKNCYADRDSHRYGFDVFGAKKERRTFGARYWAEPLRWNAQAEREGVVKRVFCSSMCDVFEDHPTIDAEREKLWPLVRETPWLDWQLLTKRADRIAKCLPKDWGHGYKNAWLGVSAENQEWANKRIPFLLAVPAVLRFVSAEPLLSDIDLSKWLRGNNNDKFRDHVSCIRCGRGVQYGQWGKNLEAQEIDRRESNGNAALLEGPTEDNSSRQVNLGRLPDYHVFGREGAAQSLCPSCCVDAGQSTDHSGRNAGESQEWNAGRFDARESGNRNAVREHNSRDTRSWEKAESAVGREQFFREDHRIGRSKDSSLGGKDGSIADSKNVRGNPIGGVGDHSPEILGTHLVHWVIAGGESGPVGKRRLADLEWFRSLRDQCEATAVPFFFKQSGGLRPGTGIELDGEVIQEMPKRRIVRASV